jgi:hypothetical protein
MAEEKEFSWIGDGDPDIDKLYKAKLRYENARFRRDKAAEQYDFAIIEWEDAASDYEQAVQSYVSIKLATTPRDTER